MNLDAISPEVKTRALQPGRTSSATTARAVACSRAASLQLHGGSIAADVAAVEELRKSGRSGAPAPDELERARDLLDRFLAERVQQGAVRNDRGFVPVDVPPSRPASADTSDLGC